MLLFAETLSEKNKWENAFKKVIKKNGITRVMSDMIDKRQREIWSTGGVGTEYNNDLKSRLKNSEIGSIAKLMANRFNIRVPDENFERVSCINFIERYLVQEKLYIKEKNITGNQEKYSNAIKNFKPEKNEIQFNLEQSESNSNGRRSINTQDFYEGSILDEDGVQLPRKNILYPLYIEDHSRIKNGVDQEKINKLKETLLGQPDNKKRRSASTIKDAPKILVNNGEIQDWNYYNQNYEVIQNSGKEDYKNLKLSINAIKKSHMKESDVINEKEMNLLKLKKKIIKINPENLMLDKNKIYNPQQECEDNLGNLEKPNIQNNSPETNLKNDSPFSTNKNILQSDQSNEDINNLSSNHSPNFIPRKILLEKSIPLNNFNLSQLEKDFVEKLKNSNLVEKENLLKTFNQVNKNSKIVTGNIPNTTKKIRQSEYFNFVKNIIENQNSKLTSTIIIPQKNNSKASKINIYGESKKDTNYIPEHFKEMVSSPSGMKKYKNSELVGKVNPEIIDYFKQSQIIETESECIFRLNGFEKLLVSDPNKNSDVNFSGKGKNSNNKVKNINMFLENHDGVVEEEFSEQINKVVINQITQTKLINTKREEKVCQENKIKKEEKNNVLKLPIHKVENIMFAQSDLLEDWKIE
jgi:hypothetical protein